MNKSRAILLLAISLMAHLIARGDQLTLKNGDRISGTVVKSDGKTLVLKSDLVGEVTIALENISTINSDKPLYVVLADGRTVVGVVSATGDNANIKTASGDIAVNRSSIHLIRSAAEQMIYDCLLYTSPSP